MPAILRAPYDMDFARPNYKFDIARVSDSNDMGKSLSRTGIMDRRKEGRKNVSIWYISRVPPVSSSRRPRVDAKSRRYGMYLKFLMIGTF